MVTDYILIFWTVSGK